MAKKSFINRDNPALNFISTAGIQDSAPAVNAAEESAVEAPDGYKRNPEYIEKKTRRLQLVLQPSLYELVKASAKKSGKSVNDYIHSLLEDATKGEK